MVKVGDILIYDTLVNMLFVEVVKVLKTTIHVKYYNSDVQVPLRLTREASAHVAECRYYYYGRAYTYDNKWIIQKHKDRCLYSIITRAREDLGKLVDTVDNYDTMLDIMKLIHAAGVTHDGSN